MAHETHSEKHQQLINEALKNMHIERRQLTREQLEEEIIDYLSKKQPCCLATCGIDGEPRASVVDYLNDGLTIYVFSEGGGKFKNIEENPRVAVGIGTGNRAIKTRGVNIWGKAEIFTDDTPEFAYGMQLFNPIMKEMEQALGKPVKIPKGLLRMIRITPTKMVYHHTARGIKYGTWEAAP